MDARDCLKDLTFEFKRLKSLAEKGLGQIPDEALFTGSKSDNSLAIIIKHVGGNLKSRWTDFLTTDGEKPDRNRDAEFEISSGESRDSLMRLWATGWEAVFDTLEKLKPDELDRTVFIRCESHTVLQAISRSLTHTAYHVGQIVFACKSLAGENWQTLSVPKGESSAATDDGKGYFNHYGK